MSQMPRKSSRRLQSVPGPAPAVPLAPPITCQEAPEYFRIFLEGQLTPEQSLQMHNHLEACPKCSLAIKEHKELLTLLNETLGANGINSDFSERADRRLLERRALASAGTTSAKAITALRLGITEDLHDSKENREPEGALSKLGAMPWWGISVALHILMITLAGLITMTVEGLNSSDATIVVTSLERAPTISPMEPDKSQSKLREVLEGKQETPPTDPDSTVSSNIVVPPDILAKAELGDHFETINPDRPDTHSAFGNPEARMFHSVQGNDEPEGGGGNGGLSLSDDLIGVGGASSPGSGGGWGGGNGTGTGIGDGSGHGSFGSRTGGGRRLMVMRHGGSKATESAVDKGLDWLARHQEADGHWDTAKYGGSMNCDPGNTGLALLAFLGAGHTEKVGKYKETVKKAVAWIISKQDPQTGEIGKGVKEPWHQNNAYYHAICGLALAEAAGMAHIPDTMKAAQLAIKHSTEDRQAGDKSDKGAWRYDPKKDADCSVSGWYVMQLKSARIAGLQVDPASFDGALKFYDEMEVKDANNNSGYPGGKFRYVKGGAVTLNTSAIGMLCNLFLGRKATELQGGADYLVQNLPTWAAHTGEGQGNHHFPMYYTYYGTLTMFQMGGDHWKRWNEALKAMLVPKQRVGGDEDGSWDPVGGDDDKFAGRVYMTAMGSLSLEVYYRYLPIVKH
ncbi:MAG: hypothetical protein HY291_16780 [Planctomycetes bacterium]|nr:hypothetical protein [Planctomycetota bacterium]